MEDSEKEITTLYYALVGDERLRDAKIEVGRIKPSEREKSMWVFYFNDVPSFVVWETHSKEFFWETV